MQMSTMLAKMDRLLPSRCIWGGARKYFFLLPAAEREGCEA